MRKIIIAGNWKMNKDNREAVELVSLLKREVSDIIDVDIVVCPPFTALSDIRDVLTDSNIAIGAQNCYWEDAGAFTGEVSPVMLKALEIPYVIIGHSERRQYFGETEETVNKRVRAALNHNLTPIVCVGENLQEREADKTFDVIKAQVEGGLKGFSAEEAQKMVLAYEPVWAIGTGKTATPDQAQDVHKYIRGLLKELFDDETANAVRIQYGGSVKPDNAGELLSQPDIDGALVGGASLKAGDFSTIIKSGVSVTSTK